MTIRVFDEVRNPWPVATALLLSLAAACSSDGDSGGQAGEACEADEECVEGLTCVALPDGMRECGLALGESCELSDAEPAADGGMVEKAEDDTCAGESLCSPFPDEEDPEMTVGRCALPKGAACVPDESDFCTDGLVCAEKTDSSHACFLPVRLEGLVTDSSDESAIEGAHVIALNDVSEAVSDVAVTDVDGPYALEVPVVRQEDGTPVDDTAFTLRVSGADYQTFPSGIRQAIPIQSSEAKLEDESEDAAGAWVIAGALANVELIPLPDDGTQRVTITGSVITGGADDDGVDRDARGTLVVAHGSQSPAPTAIADLSGNYTIFNVEPGQVTVKGYKAGLQLKPVDVSVSGDLVEDVDLTLAEQGTADVAGTINIVNAPGGSMTSVVLAVEDTFTEGFNRGEVPAGCRTGLDVQSAFTIEGVPAGRYVVLAAFENDDLVRDPDQNIAGTETVVIDVMAGQDLDIADAFKVTEALAVHEPGMDLPTPVSSAPTLIWADDSSEDYYSVEVYNALGELVWDEPMVPGVSGSETVELDYGGPLEPGMYYQFRAKSWRQSGNQAASPISVTEDLRGVFFVE